MILTAFFWNSLKDINIYETWYKSFNPCESESLKGKTCKIITTVCYSDMNPKFFITVNIQRIFSPL